MRFWLAAALSCLAASSLQAQTPGESAANAQLQIIGATRALATAGDGRDRVAALTGVVRAFEEALAAVRDSARRAAVREDALSRSLEARETEVSRLLGVLQVIGRAPEVTVLLHPSGPAGAARSGMILAELTPAVQSQVARLRADLSELQELRRVERDAAQTLSKGLSAVQEARVALSNAMAERVPLPQRFVQDPVQLALIVAAADTLSAFVATLQETQPDLVGSAIPSPADLAGRLTWPAFGTLVRRAGEADAAGIMRPGVILATAPGAIVVTPEAATVRYRGPLLDYGNVIILEPASELLLVFAGLDTLYVAPGDVVAPGDPLGLMPQAAQGGPLDRASLYIETRLAGEPVDPLRWFAQN
ncbi:MAG: peptidoglycan DD-metalloendopeptidase family protein [Pseudomonadota bacterium]